MTPHSLHHTAIVNFKLIGCLTGFLGEVLCIPLRKYDEKECGHEQQESVKVYWMAWKEITALIRTHERISSVEAIHVMTWISDQEALYSSIYTYKNNG